MKTTITKKLFILLLSSIYVVANAQCPTITSLNVTMGANGTATVNPVTSIPLNPAGGNISWSTFPAANQTLPQGIFQFSSNGTYSICANYSDSITGCFSSLCTSITITNLNTLSCNANFSTYTDSACVTHFINSSTGSNLVYNWYIYGMTSSAINPSFSLPNGTYNAALYVYSNNNFCDSVTQSITISCNTTNTNSCNASFNTFTDSNCVTHFINTSTGSNLTSSWTINNVSYPPSNSNLSLTLANGNYPILLQTYSNGIMCDSAYQFITINCVGSNTTNPTSCQANSQFYVFADSLNSGNYFAYNLSSGTGNLSYLWSFGDGTSSTQQYPFHQYAVPGQYVICLTVTATSGTSTCTDSYCDSSSVQKMASGFLMSQVNVIPQLVTSIKQNNLNADLNAFPNPILNELSITRAAKENRFLTYTLVDAIGRIILTGELANIQKPLNVSNLEKGFYYLRFTDGNNGLLKTIKLVK